MRSRRSVVLVLAAGAVVAATTAACSSILGLEPPPTGTDGGSPPLDATTGDAPGVEASPNDAPGPEADGGAPDAPSDAPVCMAIDAGGDGSTVYYPFTNAVIDDAGTHPWQYFEPNSVNPLAHNFQGGVYDGRYVYFAPNTNGTVTRYDTHGSFVTGSSWSTFDTTTLGANAQGFGGAVFDGRYVYFVPYKVPAGGIYDGVLVRYDTQSSSFSQGGSAWSTFDMGALPTPDGGLPTVGFSSGVYDGHAVYFAPHYDGAAQLSRVVRYDPEGGVPEGGPVEAGVPESGVSDGGGDAGDAGDAGHTDGGGDAGDAGDAGHGDAGEAGAPPSFAAASQFSTFDLSTKNASAAGYIGALFDGQFVYTIPYDGNAGLTGLVARYDTDASFVAGSSWTVFDLTFINANALGFSGAAFDGRFVYLVPHGKTIAARYDTQGGSLGTKSAWSTFDIATAFPATDAAAPSFTGAGYDGRFVYFTPATSGVVVRYDTWSTFGAACAWSQHDMSQDVAGAVTYYGAIYDGQYLYLVPKGTWVARSDDEDPVAPCLCCGSSLPGYRWAFLSDPAPASFACRNAPSLRSSSLSSPSRAVRPASETPTRARPRTRRARTRPTPGAAASTRARRSRCRSATAT